MNPGNGGWLIFLTIVCAMVAAIVHLPESWPQWLGWLRPAWVPMVLFYWVLAVPHRVTVASVGAADLHRPLVSSAHRRSEFIGSGST